MVGSTMNFSRGSLGVGSFDNGDVMSRQPLSIDFLRSGAFHAMLRSFFFEAMLAGYVAETPRGRLTKLPKSVTAEYKKGDFELIDVWASGESGASHGTTHILYDRHPVFAMQYIGAYAEQAIPTLKEALLEAYDAKEWHGGRGREYFASKQDAKLTYMNAIGKNDFAGHSFGEEKVFWEEELIGWHRYQSLLLA